MTAASLNPFSYSPHQPQLLLQPLKRLESTSPCSFLANPSPGTMFSPSLSFSGVRRSKRGALSMGPATSEQMSNKRHLPSPPQSSSPLLSASISNATSPGNNTTLDNTISTSEANTTPTFTITDSNATLSSSSSSSSLLSQNARTESAKVRSTKLHTSSTSNKNSPTKPLQFINKVAPAVSRPIEPTGPYIQSQSAIRQKARKQIREKGKIKRYSNCFIKYRTEMHPRIVGEFGHQNNKEISRLAGIWWHNEPEEVKRIYREQAKEEKLKHASIYPNYKYTPAKVVQPKGESTSASEDGVKKASGSETQTDIRAGSPSNSAGAPEGELKKRKEKSKDKPYFVKETPLHAFNGDTDRDENILKKVGVRKLWSDSSRRPGLPQNAPPPPENSFMLDHGPGDSAETSLYTSLGSLQASDGQVNLLQLVPQNNILDGFDPLSNGGAVNNIPPFTWTNPFSEQWRASLSPISLAPVDAGLSMPPTMEAIVNSIMTSMSSSDNMTSSEGPLPFEAQMGETAVQLEEVRPQSLPQQVSSAPPIVQSLTSVDVFSWSDFTSSTVLIPTNHSMSEARTSGGAMTLSSQSRPVVMSPESHLIGHPFQLPVESTATAAMMPVVRLDGNGHPAVKEPFLLQNASEGTWVQGPYICTSQHVNTLDNNIANNSSNLTIATVMSLPTEASQVLQGLFTPVIGEWIADKRHQPLKNSNHFDQQQQQQHLQCHDPFLPSERRGPLDLCSPQDYLPQQQQQAVRSSTIRLPQILDASKSPPDANGEEELSMNIKYLEGLVQQRKMQLFFHQQQRLATQQFQQP